LSDWRARPAKCPTALRGKATRHRGAVVASCVEWNRKPGAAVSIPTRPSIDDLPKHVNTGVPDRHRRAGIRLDLPINHFKRALAAGQSQIGLWCSLSSHYSAEVVAGAGFDWLLLDPEHSPNDLESLLTQLQAVAAYPSAPVVRVPWNDTVTIKRVLDIGAQTLLIPYVQDADEARAAAAAMRYPPAGVRGVAGATRATRFGRVKDYAQHAHEELCLLVQLETEQALRHIGAIAQIDEIDGIFIGPADLHASMGFAGEVANPQVVPLIEDALRRIRRSGKAPGILVGDEQLAKRCIEAGSLFTAVGVDVAILARGAERLAAQFGRGP
jgi:4-hydroxy-2-oxoheptanedioate aldolase